MRNWEPGINNPSPGHTVLTAHKQHEVVPVRPLVLVDDAEGVEHLVGGVAQGEAVTGQRDDDGVLARGGEGPEGGRASGI